MFEKPKRPSISVHRLILFLFRQRCLKKNPNIKKLDKKELEERINREYDKTNEVHSDDQSRPLKITSYKKKLMKKGGPDK